MLFARKVQTHDLSFCLNHWHVVYCYLLVYLTKKICSFITLKTRCVVQLLADRWRSETQRAFLKAFDLSFSAILRRMRAFCFITLLKRSVCANSPKKDKKLLEISKLTLKLKYLYSSTIRLFCYFPCVLGCRGCYRLAGVSLGG